MTDKEKIHHISTKKYIRLVPSWEAAARIFSQNLLYGVDINTKMNSAEELIKMGKQLDILQAPLDD